MQLCMKDKRELQRVAVSVLSLSAADNISRARHVPVWELEASTVLRLIADGCVTRLKSNPFTLYMTKEQAAAFLLAYPEDN